MRPLLPEKRTQMFNARNAVESIKTANMNRKHRNLVNKLVANDPNYTPAAETIFVVLNRQK